jgi:hypothetical protein
MLSENGEEHLTNFARKRANGLMRKLTEPTATSSLLLSQFRAHPQYSAKTHSHLQTTFQFKEEMSE